MLVASSEDNRLGPSPPPSHNDLASSCLKTISLLYLEKVSNITLPCVWQVLLVERAVIRDQAEWDRWRGVLILTEDRLRFERPGLPPGNFIVCFDLPITEIDSTVGNFPRKHLICNFGSQSYTIKVRNPNEWVKMLNVLRGR